MDYGSVDLKLARSLRRFGLNNYLFWQDCYSLLIHILVYLREGLRYRIAMQAYKNILKKQPDYYKISLAQNLWPASLKTFAMQVSHCPKVLNKPAYYLLRRGF